jgi:pyridoxine/pyridoxamine 5'-phosphate oxidase
MKTRLETPDQLRHQIWKELGRATQDRHHAWRTPVFATSSLEGSVNARTVVLRTVDAHANLFQIYTDARSCKAEELSSQPNAVFVFWSARLRWQLRARVRVTILTSGSQVEGLWSQVKYTSSASDYLSHSPPGASITQDDKTNVSGGDSANHFALLSAQVMELDWLELSSSGHRRARIKDDVWEWLVP